MVCKRIRKGQIRDRARLDRFPKEVATVQAGARVHTDPSPRVSRDEPRPAIEDKFRLCRVSAERVIEELAAIAFSDIGDMFGADGRILPLAEIPFLTRRAIASYQVWQRSRTRTGPGGVKVIESVEGVAVRLHAKGAALAALARYLGMFRPRPVVETGHAPSAHRTGPSEAGS